MYSSRSPSSFWKVMSADTNAAWASGLLAPVLRMIPRIWSARMKDLSMISLSQQRRTA